MASVERICQIVNERGLHARAAAHFVKCASGFNSEIAIKKGSRQVNGKSIMGILTLAAAKGSSVTLIADGIDAEDAIEELAKLVGHGFYEAEQ